MFRTIAFCLLVSLPVGAEVLPLKSSEYQVELTHEAKLPVPDGDPDKAKFVRLAKPETLKLKFSKDRRKVDILPGKISGTLEEATAGRRAYALDKGLFAGGELVIRKSKNGYEVVLTEFGSGEPVISSCKGSFKVPAAVQKEKKTTK